METILYINGSTDSGPYRMKLSGLKRYARMKKWSGKVIYCDRGKFRARELLAAHHPESKGSGTPSKTRLN